MEWSVRRTEEPGTSSSYLFLRPFKGSKGPENSDTRWTVSNVGTVKSVAIELKQNGKYRVQGYVGVVLTDNYGRERIIFYDALSHPDGPEMQVWNNPNYIFEVRNRELSRTPLYPAVLPTLTFSGLIVRDPNTDLKNFPLKRIVAVYDQAFFNY